MIIKGLFRVVVAVGTIVAGAHPVLAQNTSAERITSQRNLQKEMDDTQKLIENINNVVKPLQASLDQREAWRKLAEEESKKSSGNCTKYGSQWAKCDDLIKLHADEIGKLKTRIESLGAREKSLTERMEKTKTAKEQFDKIVAKIPDSVEKDSAQLGEVLNKLGMEVKFSAVRSAYGDTTHALQALRLNYDNAVLGAYVKDSIVRSLNSKAFCEVASSCGTPDRKKISAKDFNDIYTPDLVHGVVDKARMEDFEANRPKPPEPVSGKE